jgi:hypothetical protein
LYLIYLKLLETPYERHQYVTAWFGELKKLEANLQMPCEMLTG